jgi:MFS family permease
MILIKKFIYNELAGRLNSKLNGQERPGILMENNPIKTAAKIPWAVFAAILINLSITVPLAAALNIWIDEAYTMNTISGSLLNTLHKALTFEMQPPLYFLLMNLWGKLGSSVFFLRLFSVICVGLMIFVTVKISRKIFPEFHPGWLALAIATNPYSIWAATEMRLYAFLALLTAVLFLTFYNGYVSDDSTSRRQRRWFLVFCVLALYTQYYTAFMLAAVFFALLILRKKAALRRLTKCYVLVIICFLPILFASVRQAAQHTGFIVLDNGLFNYISIGTRFLRYPLRLEWMPTVGSLLAYAAVGAGMLYLILKYRKNIQDRHLIVWMMTLIITVFFSIFINVVNHELVNITHTTVLFIASLLAIFAAISIVPDKERKKILVPAFGLMILANSVYLIREYKPMAKIGDSRRIAAYIAQNESPGQSILVFIPEMAIPLSYYYKGTNIIIPIPKKPSMVNFDTRDFVLKSEQDIVRAIEREGRQPDNLWVVNWDLCQYLGVNYHCEILEDYIRKNYIMEDDKRFYSSRVRLLRLKREGQ